jgi:ribosomal protein S18 acetylase RimI-like enzyme
VESARAAGFEDLPVIAALAQSLRDELEPTRGGSVWSRKSVASPTPSELAALVDGHDGRLFVGLVDEVIVGYAITRVEALRDGTLLGVVEELYVDEAARAVGVGEALADLVVVWATERGCFGVDALALPGNRAAKNFFETHGFVARMIVMHKPLPG